MTPTRRQFIRQFGIMLASLALGGCFAPAVPTPPVGEIGHSREHLRGYWLRLGKLGQEIREDSAYNAARIEQLITDHHTPLNELVAAGDLSAEAAEQVQIMFDAAVRYVWDQSQTPYSSCYYVERPLIGDFIQATLTPLLPVDKVAEQDLTNLIQGSSDRLVRQALLLAELAEQEDVEPETAARMQAAIARDLALLRLSAQEVQLVLDHRAQAACTPCRRAYIFPSLEDLDLKIPPEIVEAACFLSELLLGRCTSAGLDVSEPDPLLAYRDSDRLVELLQEFWLLLHLSAERTPVDHKALKQSLEQYTLDHQELLKEFVVEKMPWDSETEAAVDRLQAAYAAAAERIWCSKAPDAICSLPAPAVAYTLASTHQMAEQISRLLEVATSCECDWAAVAQAQAAIERSLAFLTLADKEVYTLCSDLVDGAGEGRDYSSFDRIDLQITSETADTARFLVDLILR